MLGNAHNLDWKQFQIPISFNLKFVLNVFYESKTWF